MKKNRLFFRKNVWRKENLCIFAAANGALAQLARALAWHARGHRFDPDILHCPLHEDEIFDILTHKTVSKDFKLED